MKVDILQSVQALETIEADWITLVNSSKWYTPFQRYEWVHACCESLERPNSLFIITIWDGNRLVGAAPLAIDEEPTGVRSIHFIGAGISDYLGFLLADGQERVVLCLIMRAIRDTQSLWDKAILRDLPDETLAPIVISDCAREAGFQVDLSHHVSECWRLELPSSWDTYLGTISRKFGSTMERQAAKLRREMEVRIEDMASSPLWEEGLSILFELHQNRWTNKGQPGAFAQEHIRQLHRQFLSVSRSNGRVSLPVIFANGQPVAAIYLFFSHKTVYYYLSGCLTQAPWNRYSVGLQVVREAIMGAIQTGVTTFDLMRGGSTYKERLGASPYTNSTVMLFHSKTRFISSQAIRLGNQFVRSCTPQLVKQAAKTILRKSGKDLS